MTTFNESILSKLIAREIVLRQDRAPYLAFTTPIYCPSVNGVRASRVNIIAPDPLANTVQTTTITQLNGVQQTTNTVTETSKKAIGGTEVVTKIQNTIDLSSTTINYLDEFFEADNTLDFSKDFEVTFTYIYPSTSTAGDNYCVFNYADNEENMYSNAIVLRTNVTAASGAITSVEISVGSTKENATVNLYPLMSDPPLVAGSGYDFVFHWQASTQKFLMTVKEHTTGRVLLESQDRPGASADGMKPQAESQDGSEYTLANTTDYEFTSPLLTHVEVSESSVITAIDNIKSIDLNKSLNYSFDIPYDVKLKSRVDLYQLIVANARQQFLAAVNKEVAAINWDTTATSLSKTLNEVEVASTDTNADTVGKLLTVMAKVGTAPRFSVYSYDNAAPVDYVYNEDIPTVLGDNISNGKPYDFASLSDVDVPAMYYFSKPSLVLGEATYQSFMSDLASGDLKRYVTENLNIDLAHKDATDALGYCGTNDVVAVAFTEPKISIEPSKYSFKYTVTVSIYYGIQVIHLENLTRIVSGE